MSGRDPQSLADRVHMPLTNVSCNFVSNLTNDRPVLTEVNFQLRHRAQSWATWHDPHEVTPKL